MTLCFVLFFLPVKCRASPRVLLHGYRDASCTNQTCASAFSARTGSDLRAACCPEFHRSMSSGAGPDEVSLRQWGLQNAATKRSGAKTRSAQWRHDSPTVTTDESPNRTTPAPVESEWAGAVWGEWIDACGLNCVAARQVILCSCVFFPPVKRWSRISPVMNGELYEEIF